MSIHTREQQHDSNRTTDSIREELEMIQQQQRTNDVRLMAEVFGREMRTIVMAENGRTLDLDPDEYGRMLAAARDAL